VNFVALNRPSIRLAGVPGEHWWELSEPLRFTWRGVPYEVPLEMDTDGASIPRLLLAISGDRFAPDVITAAIAHDWAYASGELPRLEADQMFREALRAHGHWALGCWVKWFSVFIAGWLVWCRRPGRPWTFAGPRLPNVVDLDDHNAE
jgi:uncharacterized protein DUF1353